MRPSLKRRRMDLTLPPAMVAALSKVAGMQHTTMTAIIERSVEHYFEKMGRLHMLYREDGDAEAEVGGIAGSVQTKGSTEGA